nr:zinc finger BED domain-containing protein RICESLEEPER 2-like [Tanacetum cinerariifolium]
DNDTSVCEIGYSLREWAGSSIEVIQKMAYKMLKKFKKYWSVISGVMGMAVILDPRYKIKFLELLLPKIYGQEKTIQDGLAVIGDGIDKITDSVAFWTATPKKEQKLKEAARELEIVSMKQLAIDCKTRWNSTYLMLSVFVLYKDVFRRLKARDSQYKCLPKERD